MRYNIGIWIRLYQSGSDWIIYSSIKKYGIKSSYLDLTTDICHKKFIF